MGALSQHRCTHPERRDRKIRADVRETARAERTNEQQLVLLDARPGNSERERKKLES